jgi:sulfate transport system permease protein
LILSDVTLSAPAPVTTEPELARHLLIGLAIILMALFLFAPLVTVFAEALHQGWAAVWAAISLPDARSAIWMTLSIAAIAVPLNAVFGVAAAKAIATFDFPRKTFLITLIDLPFSVSPVVAGLMLMIRFGANSSLGAWLIAAHVRIDFAFRGILLATLFVTFPFVARELIPAMVEHGRAEEETALTLGASGWRIFFTATPPNIRCALLYGVLLCNARAMGEFGALADVSGKIHGETATKPTMVEMFYNGYLSVVAFSLASVLALLALLIGFFYPCANGAMRTCWRPPGVIEKGPTINIEIEDLAKEFRTSRSPHPVSLSIPSGALIALPGP